MLSSNLLAREDGWRSRIETEVERLNVAFVSLANKLDDFVTEMRRDKKTPWGVIASMAAVVIVSLSVVATPYVTDLSTVKEEQILLRIEVARLKEQHRMEEKYGGRTIQPQSCRLDVAQ